MGVTRGTHGYELFLASLAQAAPEATAVLMVDAAAEAALRPVVHGARHGRVHLMPADMAAIPRIARKTGRELSMQLSRYWLYVQALEAIEHDIMKSNKSSSSVFYGDDAVPAANSNTSLACPEQHHPLVLLADTRDVVFQRDPFADLRTRMAESHSIDALFAFAEPHFVRLGGAESSLTSSAAAVVDDDVWQHMRSARGAEDAAQWNTRVASGFLRPGAWAPLVHLPVLCSGTTAGSLSAVLAYARMMSAALSVTISGGQSYFVGADQPLHNLLLYHAAAQQIRRDAADADARRQAAADSVKHHQRRPIPPHLERAIAAAGAKLDAFVATEVAYSALLRLPAQLLSGALSPPNAAAGAAAAINGQPRSTTAAADADATEKGETAAATDPLPPQSSSLSSQPQAPHRITLHVIPHEEGIVCTLGLWAHNDVPLRPTATAVERQLAGDGPSQGKGDAEVFIAADGRAGRLPSDDRIGLKAATAVVYSTAAAASTVSGPEDARVFNASTASPSFWAADVVPCPHHTHQHYQQQQQQRPSHHGAAGAGAATAATAAASAGGCDPLTCPPCAVVHQYDRHMALWKWADVRWAGAGGGGGGADDVSGSVSPAQTWYCDTGLNLCW